VTLRLTPARRITVSIIQAMAAIVLSRGVLLEHFSKNSWQ